MIKLLIQAALLGVGLAMDAFSVSMANGMNEKKMAISRMIQIAIVFAGFQFLMPMIGWFAVHTVSSAFTIFMDVVPWIALIRWIYDCRLYVIIRNDYFSNHCCCNIYYLLCRCCIREEVWNGLCE